MRNKISALFVLSVFLLSMIPMAFAENTVKAEPMLYTAGDTSAGDAQDNETEVGDVDGTEEPVVAPVAVRPVAISAKQRVRAAVKEAKTDAVAVKARVRSEVRERLAEAPVALKRNIAEAQLTKARDQYKLFKQHYLTAKEKYRTQKAKFLKAKDTYKNCKGSDSQECIEKRAQIRSQAKPYLVNAADLVIKELERVKAKVEASEDLSEDEIAEIVADLDEKIQEVEDAKAVIESLDDDSTNQEINEAAKTIRNAWQKAKIALKKHAGKLVNARLGNIIHRTEMLEKRFYTARDKLAERGLDVSALDASLEEFSAHLDTAADKYLEARSIWSDANTPGEVDDAANQVKGLLKEAKDELKGAKDLLRDIVREIKQLNNGELDVADEDVEETGEGANNENATEVDEGEAGEEA